jgi:hypothetical protein
MIGSGASHPDSCEHHKAEELWVILNTIKYKVSLLINTGANISGIPFFSGPRSSKKIIVWGISG